MPVLIGTSGWQYKHWRERYYPAKLPQTAWLGRYAADFQIVEVNNTFYRLPEKLIFESWRDKSPPDFLFAVKASRYLTHIKRLRDTAEPAARFLQASAGLGPKLGPVLLQLPPTLEADHRSLKETLSHFPGGIRLAVEFRHESWFTEQTRLVLQEKGAALCMADRQSKPIAPIWRTTQWGYLRFHAGSASPHPCYGKQSLRSWAERLADKWSPDEDVYVFFNNDTAGCALRDAGLFARALSETGLRSSRVPDPMSIPVGD